MAKGNRFTEQLENLDREGDPGEGAEGATAGDASAEKPAGRPRGSGAASASSEREPAPRRNAAAPKKGAPTTTEAPSVVSVTVDGVSFTAPPGTPLHRRAVAVANALYSE